MGKSNKTCPLLGLNACFHNITTSFWALGNPSNSLDTTFGQTKYKLYAQGNFISKLINNGGAMVALRRNMGAMWILVFLEVWVVCFICWTPQYQIARNSMLGMINLDQDYFFYVF